LRCALDVKLTEGRRGPIRYFFLFVGLGLLVFVVSRIDLAGALPLAQQVGWGFVVILAVFHVAFVADSLSWQLTMTAVPLTTGWAYSVWKVRMVGEAYNAVIPAFGMGGEPIKAILLRRHHKLGYRDIATGIILSKTMILLTLIPFVLVGLALAWPAEILGKDEIRAVLAGLSIIALVAAAVLIGPGLRLSARAGIVMRRLQIGLAAQRLFQRVARMERQLVDFYVTRKRLCLGAAAFAFLHWVICTVEVYCVFWFLGIPLTFGEVWVVEATTQFVRAATFFIPASLGAQEGAIILVCTALTGSPTTGVAVAVVRRLREIMWILWGMFLGTRYAGTGAGIKAE
jgi:uncharacterized membrane protein YbhN (UPF0104 family)